MEFDFGLGGNKPTQEPPIDVNPPTNPPINPPINPNKQDPNTPPTEDPNKPPVNEPPADPNNPPQEFAIAPGTAIEFDGKNYTVDESGNIVDADGNVFKEAKDVKEWKDSLDVDNNDNSDVIDLKTIQDALKIDIVDNEGKVIEFQNTAEGIGAYINQVIENSKKDNQREAIDLLFNKYPILSDVLNYYLANGNSIEGFMETPDRSTITIDDNNVEQQENIIKTAWKEQGRRGNVDSYIDYLKSSGTLLAVAKEELEALQAADAEYKTTMEENARKAEQEAAENDARQWAAIKTMIDSKKLGDYSLPDNIVRTIDGKKVSASLEDFYNYIYRVDKNGNSAYMNDLARVKPEDQLTDNLLRAYLTFTGGNYESLIAMKLNEKEVQRLKLVSKTNAKHTALRITPPSDPNAKQKLDFGL